MAGAIACLTAAVQWVSTHQTQSLEREDTVAHGKITIKCWATNEKADELVARLATDRKFRAAVEADPVGELWHYGIELSGAGVPGTAKLASQSEFKALRTAMADRDDVMGDPHGISCIRLICAVFKFGALPFLERGVLPNGAP